MEYLKDEKEKEAIEWMLKTARIAEKALCLKARCGAIIVNNGEVIGEGYNAPPLDKKENQTCFQDFGPGKPRYDRTCCMHAEWRAITAALAKNSDKLQGSKLYFTRVDTEGVITKSPKPYCTVCSRMTLDAGVEKFVLWHEDGVCEYPTNEYNRLSHKEYVPPHLG